MRCVSAIEADHLHADRLTDLQRLAWVVDAAPGDIGDVQQAIDAAEVHECAVVGDVLHHAVEDHALLQALDQLAALLGARLLQHGAAAHDDVAAGAVHLQDLERLRRAHQRADVAHRADIDLAAGQERDCAAEVHGEAALDPAVDRAVHAHLRLERLLQVGPGLLAPRLLARQHDGAVAVLVALDIKLDVVAGLNLGLLARQGEFLERDAAFAFQADVDDGVLVGEADDAAGDDRTFKSGLAAHRFIKQGGEVFAHVAVGWAVEKCCGGGCHVWGMFLCMRPANAGVNECAPCPSRKTKWDQEASSPQSGPG